MVPIVTFTLNYVNQALGKARVQAVLGLGKYSRLTIVAGE